MLKKFKMLFFLLKNYRKYFKLKCTARFIYIKVLKNKDHIRNMSFLLPELRKYYTHTKEVKKVDVGMCQISCENPKFKQSLPEILAFRSNIWSKPTLGY